MCQKCRDTADQMRPIFEEAERMRRLRPLAEPEVEFLTSLGAAFNSHSLAVAAMDVMAFAPVVGMVLLSAFYAGVRSADGREDDAGASGAAAEGESHIAEGDLFAEWFEERIDGEDGEVQA